MLDLRLRPERRALDQLFEVLIGQYLTDQRRGGQAQPSVAQRSLQLREPAQHAHRTDAPARRAFAQVKRTQAVIPKRAESGLKVRAAAVELVQVEQELDLDVSLVADELAKATGQRSGVEGRGEKRVHDGHLR